MLFSLEIKDSLHSLAFHNCRGVWGVPHRETAGGSQHSLISLNTSRSQLEEAPTITHRMGAVPVDEGVCLTLICLEDMGIPLFRFGLIKACIDRLLGFYSGGIYSQYFCKITLHFFLLPIPGRAGSYHQNGESHISQ